MTAPIPSADVQTAVEKRYASDLLIDITNPGKPDATSIGADAMDQALEDAERFFKDEVGSESDDQYAHDILALPTIVIYMLVRNIPLVDRYREYYLAQALDETLAASEFRDNFPPESTTSSDDPNFLQDKPANVMPNPESSNNS